MNFIVERLESLLAGSSALPKYSSIADCDFLDSTPLLGNSGKVWFMQHLGAVAGSVTAGQSLPIIVEKLRKAFPPAPHENCRR